MAAETAALPAGGVPAPALPRRRELLFGSVFATSGVVMVMLTLVGAYLAARHGPAAASWLADNTIPLTQPNLQMFGLAMSVVTMQWAVYSVGNDDRANTAVALFLTLLFGAAYLNQMSFLFTQMGVKLSQPEGPLFYAVTGGHVAMVIAAMVVVLFVAFRALGGGYSSRSPDGVSAAAVFWDAMVAVYVVIWVAIYVMK